METSCLGFSVFKNVSIHVSEDFFFLFSLYALLSSTVLFSVFIIILTCSHTFKDLEK